MGAVAFVRKPVDREALIGAIDRIATGMRGQRGVA
jgi:FixJ family two-component response regulator